MKIKNINNTQKSQHSCKCGCTSWLQHWELKSGRKPPTFCIISSPDCLEKTSVAAFVQKTGDNSNSWYLAPLCQTHSTHKNTEFIVYNTWPLIEITENDFSCEKKKNELEIVSDLANIT